MSRAKQLLQVLLKRLDIQLIRASHTEPIRRLTGIRNVLNHPGAAQRPALESLGHVMLDLQLAWVLREFMIDCVLDVGANQGQFVAELRRLGYDGPVASFEPMTACIDRLRRLAMGDPAWQIFACGLGRTAGTRQLTHYSDQTFSSLHHVNADGAAEFGRLVEPTSTESVVLRTLDEVWRETAAGSGARRVLLKTDTQGHDLEVLRGGAQYLTACMAVLCEASFAPIYEGTPGYHELFAFLEDRGFECTGINPLSYRVDRPAMIEANALFINRALVRQSLAPASP